MDIVARLCAAGCVFAEDEARLLRDGATTADELEHMVARRVAGEPIEYIVGWAEFAGQRYVIEPGVFVPRHRSEFLVDVAADLAADDALVLDLCCGCGALGGALMHRRANIRLHASDVDPAAVRCTRRNVSGTVYEGDLFDPLPAELRGQVDVLLANVPYVPSDAIATMPPEAREHERRAAIDGGPAGQDVLRRVSAAAPRWLAAHGVLLVESSERQAAAFAATFEQDGLRARIVRSDDATVVIGEQR
jgi:release factor glutamine methyltransferase